MTNYSLYRDSAGISNNDMIKAVHAQFPGFSKIQNSMCSNPEKYGVCLLPEAEKLLIDAFGNAPGLQTADTAPAAPSRPKRTKPNRLVCYLTDEIYKSIREMMDEQGFTTVQEFLNVILTKLVKEGM